MLLFKAAERSLGLVSTMVLVRILSPADFGIVAMAISFIAMAEVLSAFGFDIALIQSQDADESHYHTAWTCNVILGASITAVMTASAHAVSAFYGRPDVFWVVTTLAFGSTLSGLENIGVVAFRKNLQFGREFAFLVSKKLASVVITVVLALWLRSYWALVIGTLSGRLLSTVISYAIHPFRPHLSLAQVASLMRFSRWMLLSNVVIFMKERSSDFVIGSMQGPRALGLYNLSNELSQMPMTELAAPINRALIPSFAHLQDDRESVRNAFLSSLAWLAAVMVPAGAGIWAVAPHLVPVALGSQWLDAVSLMQVLAVSGSIVGLHSPICALIIATGHPGRVAACHAFYVAVLLLGLALLTPRLSSLGAAWAALSAATVATPAYLFQLRRSVGIAFVALARTVGRPVWASIIMACAVRALIPPPPPHGADIPRTAMLLLGAVLFGIVAYGCALFGLWFASGRPDGVERATADRTCALYARLSAKP